jgi:hypothetical protein
MFKTVIILGLVSCARHGIPLLPSHHFVPSLAKDTYINTSEHHTATVCLRWLLYVVLKDS